MDLFLLILCILIALYGFYIYRKTKDIFNPMSMFAWPILVGYIIFLSVYYDETITNETLILYAIGIISFLGGFIFHRATSKYPFSYNEIVTEKELVISETVFEILKVLSVIGIIATIMYVFRTAFAGPYGSNVIRNLRYMGNYENTRGFVSTYGIVVAKVVLYVVFYQYFVLNNKRNKKWIPVLILGIIFGLLATIARTELIEVTFALYYIYSLKNRSKGSRMSFFERVKEKWRALLLVTVIITVFVIIAIQTEKLGNRNFLNTDFFFFRYAGLELKNFNSYILDHSFSTKGYHSLGIIGKLLSGLKMGPNNDLFIRVAQEFHGPVCSFIAAPYADFGISGIVFTMFIQGFFHSFVYMKSIRQGGYWSVFYTTCLYSDLMAFYAFQYMMSSQVYVLLLIIILHIKMEGAKIKYVSSNVITGR